MNGVKKGELYINKDCKHSKNEVARVSKGRGFVLQQVTNGLTSEKRKKMDQFATFFKKLKHGRPMLEYDS
jgi:hypothetical protein